MERTIRVTGRSKISVKPDTIRLSISTEAICFTYEEALNQSVEDIEQLREGFEKLGFERSRLKTLSFHIDTEYESYKDRSDDSWIKRLKGYKYNHDMKLEFDSDNKLLGKVLYMLAHCAVHPEFHISYTVKDNEAVKNELLCKAIVDSKSKAKVLTQAAGVALGEIITIDYSWGEIDIVSEPMGRMMNCVAEEASCDGAYNVDIEPDDIDVTDTVTVVWSLK